MCGEECPVLLHHCGMSCFVVERKALQRVVKAPQSIVGSSPQTTVTTNIYTSRKRASLSWKTLLTQETDCLSHSPQAGCCGASIAEPPDWGTASSSGCKTVELWWCSVVSAAPSQRKQTCEATCLSTAHNFIIFRKWSYFYWHCIYFFFSLFPVLLFCVLLAFTRNLVAQFCFTSCEYMC